MENNVNQNMDESKERVDESLHKMDERDDVSLELDESAAEVPCLDPAEVSLDDPDHPAVRARQLRGQHVESDPTAVTAEHVV